MSTSTIQHIVAMPAHLSGQQTTFQGFSIELIPDYLSIISAITHFPHDVMEAKLEGYQLTCSKTAGSSLVVRMLRVDLIDEDHCDLEEMLTVIWSTNDTAEKVAQNLKKFKILPLHICLTPYDGAVDMSSLSHNTIEQHLLDLVKRAAVADIGFTEILEVMNSLQARNEKLEKLPFVPALHNSSRPMADVLRSYGFDFSGYQNLPPAIDNAPYIASMVEMGNMIDKLRENLPQIVKLARKNDALVFCPSIMALMYKVEFWNKYLRHLPNYKRNFVKTVILRNKGYSNGSTEGREVIFNPYDDPTVGPLLQVRQFELRYFTELVSLVAVNQFVPAFRLPGAVMLHHGELGEIYALVNSNNRSRRQELNKRVAAYGKKLKEEIGEELWRAIFMNREKLLLVCDFPAEWLMIDFVPAMFRFEMSRIPTTPGNVTSHILLSGTRTAVHYSALNNVLVIRSFKDNDPIRDHLTKAVERFKLESMSIQYVDVKTKDEIVVAMNDFSGAIVIFDCHGNHGGKEDNGWLEIGKEKVDTWELANLARMPPIVILAACSTHALDGSHASVANGFLRAGVLSVLGTYAPVHSIHTAIFVGRLLYRINTFLPMLAKTRPVTWREIVSGFLRMSYVTDVLVCLQHVKGLINAEQYETIHLEANIAINDGNMQWIENLQKNVMEAAKKTEAEIREIWASNFQFVDTMLFSQLGRPENIILVDDEQDLTKA